MTWDIVRVTIPSVALTCVHSLFSSDKLLHQPENLSIQQAPLSARKAAFQPVLD